MAHKYHEHITKEEFCKMVDHACLRQCNTKEYLDKCIDECIKYGFTLCCFGCDVAYAKSRMGEGASICPVIGYPMGNGTTASKIFESLDAIDNGATELDHVINLSRLLSDDFDYVLNECKAIVNAVRAKDPTVKVKFIIEVYWLDDPKYLEKACELVIASGADYVKQATGYAPDPYHNTCGLENMAKLREICGDRILLKSAGVPDNLEQCIEMYKDYNITKFGGQFIDWIEAKDDEWWAAQ
ncbi:MAG: deoxyribose-phosphate aldolase [Ruminococcaceae bacterium]|nr:deoxyribose-phosphate aldolase [Oscillospiraceae bacterium]